MVKKYYLKNYNVLKEEEKFLLSAVLALVLSLRAVPHKAGRFIIDSFSIEGLLLKSSFYWAK